MSAIFSASFFTDNKNPEVGAEKSPDKRKNG